MLTIISLLFVIGFVLNCSVQSTNRSQDIQANSQTLERNLGALTNNDTIRPILFNWRKDSVGCLMLRDVRDGVTLAEYFALKGQSKERAIEVLGNPTEIRQQTEWVEDIKYEDCTVLVYYCWSSCQDTNKLPFAQGWVYVIINNHNLKVIRVRTAVS